MLTIVAGTWDLVPDDMRPGMMFEAMTVHTQLAVFNTAYIAAGWYHNEHLIDPGTNYRTFTNVDHVLHAYRVYIKRQKEATNPTWVRVLFFSEEHPNGLEVTLDKDGNLSTGAKGFFDQTEIALMELF
jgi:hypothetical protein